MFASPTRIMPWQSPAARVLDAADGVMDGRFFGAPIIDNSRVSIPPQCTSCSIAPPQMMMSPAARLDAADGIMDGRYFGRPIIEGVSAAPVFMTGMQQFQPMMPSPATVLDAADGVMDGRFFGRPILETGMTSTYMAPALPPPVDVSVITNVPPVGTTSVSVVECGPGQMMAMPQAPMPMPIMPPVHMQPSQSFSSAHTETFIQRTTLPGAEAIAHEFRDLRDMLDKDRQHFELSRSEFERSIAERELKVKMDQERLNGEWGRFRTEESAFKDIQARKVAEFESMRKRDHIVVKTLKEAQELDVKDGIIDGKFNGKQIEVEGHGPLVPPAHLMGRRVGAPAGGKGKGKGLLPPPGFGKGGKGIGMAGKGAGKGGPLPPGGLGGAANVVLPAGSPPKFTLGQAPKLPPAGTFSPPAGKGIGGKGGPIPAGKGGKGGPMSPGKGKGKP